MTLKKLTASLRKYVRRITWRDLERHELPFPLEDEPSWFTKKPKENHEW